MQNVKRTIINIFILTVFLVIMTGITLLFSAEIKFNAAKRYVINKQWDKAEAAYEEAVCIMPFSSEYWLGYGDFLWYKSDFFKEVTPYGLIKKAYMRAIHVNPRYAECWIKLGQIQFDAGEKDAAASNFKKALELDPNGTDTAYWIDEYKKEFKNF